MADDLAAPTPPLPAARQRKVGVPGDTAIAASVDIDPLAERTGFGLAVALEVSILGLDPAAALELVEAAHAVCPYSNATRGNIEVRLSVA